MKVTELKEKPEAIGLPTSETRQELFDEASSESVLSSILDEEDEIQDDALEEPEAKASVVSCNKPTVECNISTCGSTVAEKKVALNGTSKTSNLIPITFDVAQTETISHEASKRKMSVVEIMSALEMLASSSKKFRAASHCNVRLKTVSNSLYTVSKYKMVKTSMEQPDVKVLKKRAERFGENVSNIMKQIEAKKQIINRKLRFGVFPAAASSVSSND